MIIVTAIARAKLGKERELFEALRVNALASRKETGCISYEVYRSCDDPRLLSTIEQWIDAKDIARHFEQQHVKDLLQQVPALCDGQPQINTWVKQPID